MAVHVRQEIPNRTPVIAWLPRSQCGHISKLPVKPGQPLSPREAVITVPDWLCDQHDFQPEA